MQDEVSTPHQSDPTTDTKGRRLPPASSLRGQARRREDTSSAFVRAPNRTAAETSAALGETLASAVAQLASDPPLSHPTVTVQRLLRWHRAVFGELFRREAGRVRHVHEQVVFSNEYIDDDGQVRPVVFHGLSNPKDIEAALETTCARFADAQRQFAVGAITMHELAEHLAELLASLLRIHPFIDGNHRIVGLALQAVIRDVTGSIQLLPDFVETGADLELALLGERYRQRLVERLALVLTLGST